MDEIERNWVVNSRGYHFNYKTWRVQVRYDPVSHKKGCLTVDIAHAIESGWESSRARSGHVASADHSYAYSFQRTD